MRRQLAAPKTCESTPSRECPPGSSDGPPDGQGLSGAVGFLSTAVATFTNLPQGEGSSPSRRHVGVSWREAGAFAGALTPLPGWPAGPRSYPQTPPWRACGASIKIGGDPPYMAPCDVTGSRRREPHASGILPARWGLPRPSVTPPNSQYGPLTRPVAPHPACWVPRNERVDIATLFALPTNASCLDIATARWQPGPDLVAGNPLGTSPASLSPEGNARAGDS